MLSALVLLPTACTRWQGTAEATATEQELCSAWNGSLPTRSRKDTPQTQAEIGHAYDVHIAACEMGLPF